MIKQRGQYTVKFVPPVDDWDTSSYPSVEMTMSDEADMIELLTMFQRFLHATGFPVNFEDELVLKREEVKVGE
jgi:hypothetical protein